MYHPNKGCCFLQSNRVRPIRYPRRAEGVYGDRADSWLGWEEISPAFFSHSDADQTEKKTVEKCLSTIFYDIYGHMCLKLGEICSHSGFFFWSFCHDEPVDGHFQLGKMVMNVMNQWMQWGDPIFRAMLWSNGIKSIQAL